MLQNCHKPVSCVILGPSEHIVVSVSPDAASPRTCRHAHKNRCAHTKLEHKHSTGTRALNKEAHGVQTYLAPRPHKHGVVPGQQHDDKDEGDGVALHMFQVQEGFPEEVPLNPPACDYMHV